MCYRTSAYLAVISTVASMVAAFWSTPAVGGCGCDKPPPPLASIRPSFASPGRDVSLFADGLVLGRRYTVTFGEDPSTMVEATATLRRDFADAVAKAQLVVAAPELPPGPTSVTVADDSAVILHVSTADFTMLPPPLVLLEGNVKTLITSYRTAVGLDGTVYFPLDIRAIAEATTFEGRAIGYRLTFGASDVMIYNTQGVLMQLLDAESANLYEIHDDADAPDDENDGGSPSTSRSFELAYTRHEFLTYLDDHDTNPNKVLNPGDSSWHIDGSRHIDHFQLVVAIRGFVDTSTTPGAGATPSFTLRVKTGAEHGGNGNGHNAAVQRTVDATAGGPANPVLALACSARPETPCSQTTESGASSLTINKRDNPLRDRLEWVWKHGELSSPRDFGDLRRRHAVAFCLYDESTPTPQLLIESGIAGGAKCRRGGSEHACWRGSGDPPGQNAFRYANPVATPGGISKLVLSRSGKKNASIALKTSGDRVPLPTLPLAAPLRAQLQSANGKCWEATYSTVLQSSRRFKAVSD